MVSTIYLLKHASSKFPLAIVKGTSALLSGISSQCVSLITSFWILLGGGVESSSAWAKATTETSDGGSAPPWGRSFPETSRHVGLVCPSESASASLFDSHVELMTRKLGLVCLLLRTIPRVNKAEAKAVNAPSVSPPCAPSPQKTCVRFLHIRSH